MIKPTALTNSLTLLLINHLSYCNGRKNHVTLQKKQDTMDNLESSMILNQIKAAINQREDAIASQIGAKIYRSENGFSQEQIYVYGGRTDSVFTLTLRKDSPSHQKYGELVTGCIVYSLKERQLLEKDVCALNAIPFVKVKSLLPEHNDFADKLLEEGISTCDIEEMLVIPNTTEANTFISKEKRDVKVLDVPFEVDENGDDIGWIYGFLKKLKSEGVGLMPEDEAQYLAYKLIIEKEELTEKEKKNIFDNEGRIFNNSVSYYYLIWRKVAGLLNEKQQRQLSLLKQNLFVERLALSDHALKHIGLNLKKFASDYPTQAAFLLEKILSFKDINFNTDGKYPLYLNFNSFLHIYLRHTEELNICNQFADRDKFQLEEKDIMTVIGHVMRALNSEYQEYKQRNPNGRFYRRGAMAYYFNGDYYNVDVNPDGSISTFYKGSGN